MGKRSVTCLEGPLPEVLRRLDEQSQRATRNDRASLQNRKAGVLIVFAGLVTGIAGVVLALQDSPSVRIAAGVGAALAGLFLVVVARHFWLNAGALDYRRLMV